MIDNPAYDVDCTLVVGEQLSWFVVRISSKNQPRHVDETDIQLKLQMCCNFCNSSIVQ